MSFSEVNKVKPPESVIDFFESIGFQYHVITDSIYSDGRDSPIHFFQTDNKFHTQDCSTVVAEDAIKIYNKFLKINIDAGFGLRCEKDRHFITNDNALCKACRSEASTQAARKRRANAPLNQLTNREK